MKEYAESFYKSKTWQKTREAYLRYRGGLCEDCLAKGVYRPGVIVHHKEQVTPLNIDNPEITLSWDNLRLLCRECHEAKHSQRKRRYKIDELGRVTCRD